MKSLLFFLLLVPGILSFADDGSSDMSFTDVLALIQRDDLLENQQAVFSPDGLTLYFIHGGNIMKVMPDMPISSVTTWLRQYGFEAVLMYEDNLLSVYRDYHRSTGDIVNLIIKVPSSITVRIPFFYNLSDRYSFDENIDKVLVTDEGDLVVLAQGVLGGKKLWAFPGPKRDEEVKITFTEKRHYDNIFPLPLVNERPLVLVETGIRGVKEIRQDRGGTVLIEYHDGGIVDYKSLGFSLEHSEQRFVYSKNMDQMDIGCEYSDGSRKKILRFNLKKRKGGLYVESGFIYDSDNDKGIYISLPIVSLASYMDIFKKYSWKKDDEQRGDDDMNAQDLLSVLNNVIKPQYNLRGGKLTIKNCFIGDPVQSEVSPNTELISKEQFKRLQYELERQ